VSDGSAAALIRAALALLLLTAAAAAAVLLTAFGLHIYRQEQENAVCERAYNVALLKGTGAVAAERQCHEALHQQPVRE
jgi:hypothetical protein